MEGVICPVNICVFNKEGKAFNYCERDFVHIAAEGNCGDFKPKSLSDSATKKVK